MSKLNLKQMEAIDVEREAPQRRVQGVKQDSGLRIQRR